MARPDEETSSVEEIQRDAYRLAFPQVKVKDPLSDVTRKERRSLLAVCLLALVVVKVGLLPEEITALGIKFAAHDKGGLIHLLAFIVIFYLIAFVIYSLSDFITWRLAFVAELKKLFKEVNEAAVTMQKTGVNTSEDSRIRYLEYRWNLISTPTSVMRAILEFVVPIALAIYSIVILWNFKTQ